MDQQGSLHIELVLFAFLVGGSIIHRLSDTLFIIVDSLEVLDSLNVVKHDVDPVV